VAGGMTIAEQIDAARELLNQTQAGKVGWNKTGDQPVFTSVRSQAVAVLDRTGQPPLVRLRFRAIYWRDNDMVVEQMPPGNQPADRRELDMILMKLWQVTGSQVLHSQTAADLFLHGQ
jgi:hypothetical protein